MTTAPRLALTAIALVASVTLASAQTAQDHQAHHPGTDVSQATQPPMGPGQVRPAQVPA